MSTSFPAHNAVVKECVMRFGGGLRESSERLKILASIFKKFLKFLEFF